MNSADYAEYLNQIEESRITATPSHNRPASKRHEGAYILACAIGVFCSQVLGMGWFFGIGVLFVFGPLFSFMLNVLAISERGGAGAGRRSTPEDIAASLAHKATVKDRCIKCDYKGLMIIRCRSKILRVVFLILTLLVTTLMTTVIVVNLIEGARTRDIHESARLIVAGIFLFAWDLAFFLLFLWLSRRVLECPKCSAVRKFVTTKTYQ